VPSMSRMSKRAARALMASCSTSARTTYLLSSRSSMAAFWLSWSSEMGANGATSQSWAVLIARTDGWVCTGISGSPVRAVEHIDAGHVVDVVQRRDLVRHDLHTQAGREFCAHGFGVGKCVWVDLVQRELDAVGRPQDSRVVDDP